MKIKSINKIGRQPVYDIEVEDVHHYVLENGVLSHNSGILYSADVVINIVRSQEKKGTELVGYNFNMNVMKSRHSREKSRVPLQVFFDGGVNVWSGLLEMALASGDICKPANGWYQVVDPDTGELIGNKVRAADTNTREFWQPVLERDHFKRWVKSTFSIAESNLLAENRTMPQADDNQFVAVDE